jgi:DNA-binding NtrC family response regulator
VKQRTRADQRTDQHEETTMMHALDRRPFKDKKRELVNDFERRYLHHLLERHRFNLSAVERSSGLSRKHICALIQKHGLQKHGLRARIVSLVPLSP